MQSAKCKVQNVESPWSWRGRWGSALLIAALMVSTAAQATRLKDISNFVGVRNNQLIGYGLVVGLDGTGDSASSDVMRRSLGEALAKMGVGADPAKFQVKNVAAIMVTATLPPFAKVGSAIDVLVSSIGDAKSLKGGTLLMTPIKGANQEVYAVAQGPLSVGGFEAEAASGGSTIQKNHQTVAKLTNGALVEKEVDFGLAGKAELEVALNQPDFTTAVRMAQKINEHLGSRVASAPDSGSVKIRVPGRYRGKISTLIAEVETLEIQPDVAAHIVVNERTGTVVMGENVRVSTVAVAHGNLSIQIDQNYQVSQPNALSQGQTVTTPQTDFTVTEEKDRKLVLVPEGVTIGDVVRALNAIGVTPRDLISVLQAIKAAGALQGELMLI
ncbi:MAG: flagellar basal body P-ring protein FlgI [Deltaproteobacteria bacterium]|nr:flagellar basal body P-ring protein FlgI [Deltaproteobacteria bacterium]